MILRERLVDNYDPDARFGWIVEMDCYNGSWEGRVSLISKWAEYNAIDHYAIKVKGRVIGFVNRDDALMFYLTFA